MYHPPRLGENSSTKSKALYHKEKSETLKL